MNFLAKLFSKKSKNGQAVIVYLDGQGLAQEVYEKCDLATLEDQLIEIVGDQSLGEFDGNEMGPEEVTLYLYGPNAEALFAGIEPTLRAYPLCANARVTIRHGSPGAPQREVRMPAA